MFIITAGTFKNKLGKRLGATVAVFALLLFHSAAYAQLASTTSLVGDITDSSNAIISGATIVATNVATRETFTTTSSTTGYYEIKFVKAGTYTITVQQAGFQTLEKTGIIVETNHTVRTDFTMEIGRTSQTTTVASTAPPVVTDEPTIRETLDQKSAAELPLNGRDSLKLGAHHPGRVIRVQIAFGIAGRRRGFHRTRHA